MSKKHKTKELEPGKVAVFYSNPYFNELMVFLESVPTSQEKLRPIDKEKGLFQLYHKNNVTEFKKRIQERLLDRRKPWWPFKERLTVVVSITGPKKDIEHKDLDNLLKTIFDSFKGIVFDDDHKIFRVQALKQVNDFKSGFIIGIRIMSEFDDEPIPYYMFSSDDEDWQTEKEAKIKSGEVYSFDTY